MPDFLKALGAHGCPEIELRQDKTCQSVLLKRNPLAGWIYPCEGIHKRAAPRAGVKKAFRFHAGILQGLGNSLHNVLGSIEGGQHGSLQRIHIT